MPKRAQSAGATTTAERQRRRRWQQRRWQGAPGAAQQRRATRAACDTGGARCKQQACALDVCECSMSSSRRLPCSQKRVIARLLLFASLRATLRYVARRSSCGAARHESCGGTMRRVSASGGTLRAAGCTATNWLLAPRRNTSCDLARFLLACASMLGTQHVHRTRTDSGAAKLLAECSGEWRHALARSAYADATSLAPSAVLLARARPALCARARRVLRCLLRYMLRCVLPCLLRHMLRRAHKQR